MKTTCFLMMMFFIAQGAISQSSKFVNGDTLNRTDANNLKQGYWEEDMNGIFTKGYYFNDKKDGTWVTYSLKGIPLKIESIRNGKKEGITLFMDDNGNYKNEMNYKNDMLDGPSKTYAIGGRILTETNYRKGVLNGAKKTYYESNNKIQEESIYVDNNRDGVSKWYGSNGNLVAEFIYKNGQFEGVNKTYGSKGELLSEQTFVNNIEQGLYKEYFEAEEDTAVVSKEKTAINNKETPKGKEAEAAVNPLILKISGNYISGNKEGKWLEFDKRGKIIKTVVYKKGVAK